ncbi:MAG TPA: VPDSG-CTERM sorting domain-containing protein [Opitutaceae bacterium]|jgi:hypothetical protein
MKSLLSISNTVKLLALSGLCAGASALAGQSSGQVYLAVGPNYGGSNSMQFGDGGEFTAVLFSNLVHNGNSVTFTPAGVPAGYAATALGSIAHGESSGYSAPGGDGGSATDVGDNPFVGITGFETFCLEDHVDFYVGNYYNYTLGLSVQQAGTSASNTPINSLTAGVAFLYQQFAIGHIVLSTPTQAGLFQAAIWYLQGQPDDANVGNFSPSNPYYLDVLNHMSLTAAQTGLVGSDPYGVEVMELTGPAGSPSGFGGASQDQLIYVPDTSTTAALFALGLAAIGFARRTRQQA